ncbi:MAG: adenylate/guanylate cyclase domain-containing protein, partial [Bacteroidota bacterium]|nr:adenylate/guanylate cyclase domain-containing protein [Bacteroidota bacterium]
LDLDQHWLYHPGDDSSWAYPDLNDSDWDTASPILNLSNKDEDYFPGIAWFRLHIEIDSSLRNTPAVLMLTQQGASEIYLNGKWVTTLGTIGTDQQEEVGYTPINLPLQIQFEDTTRYVLAVRYSNQNAWLLYKTYHQAEAGFSVSMTILSIASRVVFFEMQSSFLIFFLFMVFLVLGLMHLLLYLFYKYNKSNLYYSIFMVLFSFLLANIILNEVLLSNPLTSTRLSYYTSLFFPLFFIPFIGFLYSLFYKKIPKLFWLILAIALLLVVLYFYSVNYIQYIFMAFTLMVFIEVVRTVIRAWIKKKDGAWIIGIGVLLFILFFTSMMSLILTQNTVTISSNDPYGLLLITALLLAILSIPISMSIYLARDFALTNRNLKIQLEQVKVLSAKTIQQEKDKQKILEGQKEKLEVLVKERTKELAQEKEKTEDLLLNILPLKVVNDLKTTGRSVPESFENVTVFFSDVVGFTKLSTELEPNVLIDELNDIFTAFDDIMSACGCERIKTIGDAYLAVCGLPKPNDQHARNIIDAAIKIRKYLEKRNAKASIKWRIRIGIHSGKVVGGVVGVRKYIYDVFGDTINTTSRMESNSEPMQINVSETTYEMVKDHYGFTPREIVEIKGKGEMRMFFLSEKTS